MDLNVLVHKAQQGDNEAFTEICQRFLPLVKKHANQAHLRPEREDAYAEALLALSTAVASYSPESGVPVAGFIESRVRYAVWNFYKREKRHWQQEILPGEGQGDEEQNGINLLPDTLDIAQTVENKLLAKEILLALKELPPKQQLVIYRTVMEDFSLTAIAEEAGVSVQAVYNLRKRALARLKILCSRMYVSERG